MIFNYDSWLYEPYDRDERSWEERQDEEDDAAWIKICERKNELNEDF